MKELIHNVVEQPVQCPASPVASRAMLESEEAELCVLGSPGNKDETSWAGVISTISPEDAQCLRTGAGWGAPGCKGHDCRAGGERGWDQPCPAHHAVLLLRASQPGGKGVGDTSCTSNILSPSSQARMAPQI